MSVPRSTGRICDELKNVEVHTEYKTRGNEEDDAKTQARRATETAGAIEDENDKWIPHVYCSIKSKCDDANGRGRTCVKEAHSCCRKIVSTQWKVKGKWKQIGRAMETMTKRYSGGSETWTLKTAASDLRDRIRRVKAATCEPTERCKRCRKEKKRWEGIVANAGQFYEACHAQKVEKCAKEIGAAWIQETGTTTITVEKCKDGRHGQEEPQGRSQ